MDKKEIDNLIKELEAQYPTDERFRKGIEQIVSNLSILLEKDLKPILNQMIERYKGYSETKAYINSMRLGIEEISENLQQIGKNYGQAGQGMAEMGQTIGRIAKAASEIESALKEGIGELEQAKANMDKTSTILQETKQALTQTEIEMKEHQKSQGYKPAPIDPKKLN